MSHSTHPFVETVATLGFRSQSLELALPFLAARKRLERFWRLQKTMKKKRKKRMAEAKRKWARKLQRAAAAALVAAVAALVVVAAAVQRTLSEEELEVPALPLQAQTKEETTAEPHRKQAYPKFLEGDVPLLQPWSFGDLVWISLLFLLAAFWPLAKDCGKQLAFTL